jgi:CheY-like chemotaxis protein
MARQDTDRRRTPRPQVLVVAEDTDSLRELWKVWLGSLGFEVIAASTGAQAVALATTYRPLAIIMDLAMPVMDGLEATRPSQAGRENGGSAGGDGNGIQFRPLPTARRGRRMRGLPSQARRS